MTDHYSTLGVDKNASQSEIKKAFKKLAHKYHPDKGGDQTKFKEISAAYEVIGDEDKRAEYDHNQYYGHTTHQFHDDFYGNFHDIFSHHFNGGASPFGDIFGRRVAKNRDLNLQCHISLSDSFIGKQLEAKYTLPSGKPQTVVIDLPAGVSHGDTINYQGLGDDSIPNIPRGNLHVTVLVNSDEKFERREDDLYATIEINPIEAIIGCTKEILSITGERLTMTIRPGVETGTEYARSGAGFKNIRRNTTGRFVTVIKIKTPIITDTTILEQLSQINKQINKL